MPPAPTKKPKRRDYGGTVDNRDLKDQLTDVQRAWAAVEAARRQAPIFQAFGKAITGKRMPVVINAFATCTDGETIFIQPPLELGDPGASRHIGHLCHQHAEDGLSKCGACRIQEVLLSRVYHELAHPFFGTLAAPTSTDISYAADEALKRAIERGVDESKARDAILKLLSRRDTEGYMGLANAISVWLPLIINTFEDFRVNECVFQYQPGMRRVLGSDIRAAVNGIIDVQLSGKKTFATEFLAMLSVYSEASEWDGEWRALKDDTITALVDSKPVRTIIGEVKTAKSVGQVFKLGNEFLALAQAKGLFIDPDPNDKYNEEEESGDCEGEAEGGESGNSTAVGQKGNSAAGSTQPGGDQGDSADGDATSDQPDGPGSCSKGKPKAKARKGKGLDGPEAPESAAKRVKDLLENILGHGDESPVNEDGTPDDSGGGSRGSQSFDLELAISESEWFAGPSQKVRGVRIIVPGDPIDPKMSLEEQASWRIPNINSHYEASLAGKTSRYGDEQFVKRDGTELSKLAAREAGRARLVFAANRAVKNTRNQEHGKIYRPTMPRKLKTGDYKIFGEKTRPDQRDYAVLVGVDVSGSTSRDGDDRGESLNVLSRKCAYVQMDLLNRIGIRNTACYAHTGNMVTQRDVRGDRKVKRDWYDGVGSSMEVGLYQIKSWDQPWDNKAKARMDSLQPLCSNLDGHTFEAYLKLLHRVPATHRILLYFTDGAMPAENHMEELEILKTVIPRAQREPGMSILTVGVQNDDPKKHGLDMVRLDGPADIGRVTEALREKIQ